MFLFKDSCFGALYFLVLIIQRSLTQSVPHRQELRKTLSRIQKFSLLHTVLWILVEDIKLLGLETKDVTIHGTASSMSFIFVLFSIAPSSSMAVTQRVSV